MNDFDDYCSEMLPRLLALGESITRSRVDAEDVAIECLARAYVRWNRLRGASWRDGWVLKVGANLAIDLVRRRRTMPEPIAQPHEPQRVLEDRDLLIPALRKLPRRQQQTVVLFYICDLPHSEIARLQHVSVGTVKTQLHRALRTLRIHVESSAAEEPRVQNHG